VSLPLTTLKLTFVFNTSRDFDYVLALEYTSALRQKKILPEIIYIEKSWEDICYIKSCFIFYANIPLPTFQLVMLHNPVPVNRVLFENHPQLHLWFTSPSPFLPFSSVLNLWMLTRIVLSRMIVKMERKASEKALRRSLSGSVPKVSIMGAF